MGVNYDSSDRSTNARQRLFPRFAYLDETSRVDSRGLSDAHGHRLGIRIQ